MKCLKCSNKGYYGSLCSKHFMENIEARIRKEMRLKELIKKDDVLVINDPICMFFIKKVMKGMPLKIIKSEKGVGKFLRDGKRVKFVLPWTLDDEILSFLIDFFGEKAEGIEMKKKTDSLKEGLSEIKPLKAIKEDELITFAKLAKVKFKKKKRTAREEEIKKAIEKIDKRHQETKFSLLRSIGEIKNLKEA